MGFFACIATKAEPPSDGTPVKEWTADNVNWWAKNEMVPKAIRKKLKKNKITGQTIEQVGSKELKSIPEAAREIFYLKLDELLAKEARQNLTDKNNEAAIWNQVGTVQLSALPYDKREERLIEDQTIINAATNSTVQLAALSPTDRTEYMEKSRVLVKLSQPKNNTNAAEQGAAAIQREKQLLLSELNAVSPTPGIPANPPEVAKKPDPNVNNLPSTPLAEKGFYKRPPKRSPDAHDILELSPPVSPRKDIIPFKQKDDASTKSSSVSSVKTISSESTSSSSSVIPGRRSPIAGSAKSPKKAQVLVPELEVSEQRLVNIPPVTIDESVSKATITPLKHKAPQKSVNRSPKTPILPKKNSPAPKRFSTPRQSQATLSKENRLTTTRPMTESIRVRGAVVILGVDFSGYSNLERSRRLMFEAAVREDVCKNLLGYDISPTDVITVEVHPANNRIVFDISVDQKKEWPVASELRRLLHNGSFSVEAIKRACCLHFGLPISTMRVDDIATLDARKVRMQRSPSASNIITSYSQAEMTKRQKSVERPAERPPASPDQLRKHFETSKAEPVYATHHDAILNRLHQTAQQIETHDTGIPQDIENLLSQVHSAEARHNLNGASMMSDGFRPPHYQTAKRSNSALSNNSFKKTYHSPVPPECFESPVPGEVRSPAKREKARVGGIGTGVSTPVQRSLFGKGVSVYQAPLPYTPPDGKVGYGTSSLSDISFVDIDKPNQTLNKSIDFNLSMDSVHPQHSNPITGTFPSHSHPAPLSAYQRSQLSRTDAIISGLNDSLGIQSSGPTDDKFVRLRSLVRDDGIPYHHNRHV